MSGIRRLLRKCPEIEQKSRKCRSEKLCLLAKVCTFAVCMLCHVGQPAAPPQTDSAARVMPTASNNQFQPRQRLPTIPRTVTPQPRFTRPTSATPRALGVAVRPRTPTGTRSATPVAPVVAARPRTPIGTRPTRPLTGIARPTVVRNVVMTSEPQALDGANTLPVPRSTMAPSRIAAIMMRRQYSSDRVRVIYAS